MDEPSFGYQPDPQETTPQLEWGRWPERWIPAMYYGSYIFPRQLKELTGTRDQLDIVDFGGGRGTLAHNLAMRAAGQMITQNDMSQPLKFTSYDPHQNADPMLMQVPPFDVPLPIEIQDQNQLPDRADLVTCHFSLHHTADPGRTIRDQIAAQLKPRFLTIMEFDFASLPGSPTERLQTFERVFTASNFGVESAEAQELKSFIREADGDSEEGLRRCFEFHQQFSTADYLRFLKDAGYQVTEAYRPALTDDRPAIMLVAERIKKYPHTT